MAAARTVRAPASIQPKFGSREGLWGRLDWEEECAGLTEEQEEAESDSLLCPLLPAGQFLSTRGCCKCSLSGRDLGAESAAQLSVLLDYQLIRAVKSPLLNNQHGAFWQLGTSGRGREAVQSLAEVD